MLVRGILLLIAMVSGIGWLPVALIFHENQMPLYTLLGIVSVLILVCILTIQIYTSVVDNGLPRAMAELSADTLFQRELLRRTASIFLLMGFPILTFLAWCETVGYTHIIWPIMTTFMIGAFGFWLANSWQKRYTKKLLQELINDLNCNTDHEAVFKYYSRYIRKKEIHRRINGQVLEVLFRSPEFISDPYDFVEEFVLDDNTGRWSLHDRIKDDED